MPPRPLLRFAVGTLALLVALAGGGAWLVGSQSGLHALAGLAAAASGGRLVIERIEGRLLDHVEIGALRWTTPALKLEAEQLHLAWSPAALGRGRLQIAELSAGRLHLDVAGSDEPARLPADLGLPFDAEIERLAVARLEIGAFVVRDLAARLDSGDGRHRVTALHAASGAVDLDGDATLAAAAPFALNATAKLTGRLDQRPLALRLTAAGPLARIAVAAVAEAGLQGEAKAELTPFAPAPFARAAIALDHLDPAAWRDGAPVADLRLRADLAPAGAGIAGRFALDNGRPGPLDRRRLPLLRLSGQLAWQDGQASLDDLRATLTGNGELAGRGRWQAGALHLDLAARRLDAAALLASLRPTRLHGPLKATLGGERQELDLDLQDADFRLQATARHAAGRVELSRLDLAAGPARLGARGELALDDAMRFTAAGEVQRFDPARFARVPAALLNADFSAGGRLQPQPQFEARFALRDSRLAGQPLAGQGEVGVDWPRLPKIDVQLTAGPNRLAARGAFGQDGQALQVELDAPQLAPYGLSGGITGRLDLAGTPARPQLTARAQAAQLGWPGVFRLTGLKLDAQAGDAPEAPLRVDLAVARLDTPERPGLAEQVRLQVEGSTQAHRIRATARLADKMPLVLAASGGLADEAGGRAWRGQLLEAGLNDADKSPNLRLLAPAALRVGAAGWRLGPAELGGRPNDWRASLQAAADARRLRATLGARGPRLGRIDGDLQAAMQGPWALGRAAPWQGSLHSDIADLGWLPELIGEQWQSEGRFAGELTLTGTPAKPLASGRFRGDKLALRLPDQGLNLARGELDIELDNNLLRVRRLGFDSLLAPMPRVLRLAAGDAAGQLTQKPGRLEVSGEMKLDRDRGADQAFLDLRLDRLGAFQLPDQWVVVSGDGRLTWQGDTLGARARLAVDAGYWQLAPGGAPHLSDDVVIKRPDQSKPAALRPKLDLDVTAELGRHFLFNGAGLSARLAGDLRLRASGRDLPRASGSIRARDGRFDAYGQQLAIERGILTFQGLLDNPALDVRAVRKGLAVEPGVQIGGTARRPVVKLVSDPELPEAEKLAWLVLGHGPEQMSAGDATLLLSAAGGLLGNESGGVVQQLKKNFGLDEFGVRSGQLGDSGSRQPGSRVAGGSADTTGSTGTQILSVGKRLSSNALLSYEQALGKAESIVKLTVRLSRQISLIGRAGSDNALDIFYTLSFGRDEPAER